MTECIGWEYDCGGFIFHLASPRAFHDSNDDVAREQSNYRKSLGRKRKVRHPMADDVTGDVFINLLSEHLQKYLISPSTDKSQLHVSKLILDPYQLSYILGRIGLDTDNAHAAGTLSSATLQSGSSTLNPSSYWSLPSLFGTSATSNSTNADASANLAFLAQFFQNQLQILVISPNSPSIPNKIQGTDYATSPYLQLVKLRSMKALYLNKVDIEAVGLADEHRAGLMSLSCQNSVRNCDSLIETLNTSGTRSAPLISLVDLDLSCNKLDQFKRGLVELLPALTVQPCLFRQRR